MHADLDSRKDLEKLILQCLAKESVDRPPSAEALGEALRDECKRHRVDGIRNGSLLQVLAIGLEQAEGTTLRQRFEWVASLTREQILDQEDGWRMWLNR